MSNSRRQSLLDKMEEIAEEQADAEAGLVSESQSSGDIIMFDEDEDDDEDDDDEDDDDEDDDEDDDDEDDDDDDGVVGDDSSDLQRMLNKELASEVMLLEDDELEEILDASLYQYGDTNALNMRDSSRGSRGTPEDMDDSEFLDTPTPLDEEMLLKYSYEVDPNSDVGSLSSDVSGTTASFGGSQKRSSFANTRRSVSSENDMYPAGGNPGGAGNNDNDGALRRNTFTVPDQTGVDKRKGRSSIRQSGTSSHSDRRSQNSLYRSTRPGTSSTGDDSSASSGFRPKMIFAGRRSTRRAKSQALGGSGSGGSAGIAAAADILGKQDATAWENVAAAAAIVAATAVASNKRKHVQFSTDDRALVLVSMLNYTNQEDDTDMFTIDPVNAFGFPAGGGNTEAEKQGPYSFVLTAVTKVHFDEDEKYYTVRRLDTGTEQRADSGWMEPLKAFDGGIEAIEAALNAAHRTKRSAAEEVNHVSHHDGLFLRCVKGLSGCLSWPAQFARTSLIPFYRDFRAGTKDFVASTLHGDSGYAYRVSCTSINFLVLCSFIYLFIQPLSLAFMPAEMDFGVAVMEFIVWIILGLELLFEYLIRPSDYHDLIRSDKAFAPSTARHINSFHLFFESLSLLLFIPQLPCVFNRRQCGDDILFSSVWASVHAVYESDLRTAAFARGCLGLTFLKAFGLFRHWKQMWINRTFERGTTDSYLLRRLLLIERKRRKPLQNLLKRRKADDDAETMVNDDDPSENMADDGNEEDQGLKNAATIGTSLMVINSHRALFILLFIATLFPAIHTFGRGNPVATYHTDLLQAYNLAAPTNNSYDCDFLENAVGAWLKLGGVKSSTQFHDEYDDTPYLVWAQLLPSRCDWQETDGVITICDGSNSDLDSSTCNAWNESKPENVTSATTDYFADIFGLRVGGFQKIEMTGTDENFYVKVIYNAGYAIALSQTALFILLLAMLVLGLVGLTAMRGDAGRLVLDPLQRMLKIVVRYAENPLALSGKGDGRTGGEKSGSREQLGNYETEQLINAIAKIADLLRKCWGVAGAGIISSNLARTKDGMTVVFNPTVPGKRVYALFGFVAINDFSRQLRALDRDVMILINDVSRVVHDEVYRWSLGGSGQCNKNLGKAFLMVFRIGDFNEVHAKQRQATTLLFRSKVKVRRRRSSSTTKRRGENRSSQRRASSKHFDLGSDGTLHLSSLPGIQSFTDRALLGFLKSFAGLHRDKKLFDWQKDFRLGAGVGAFTVSVIYGMDAGWAVEGAVGSEYKIDATYLSPHVNMASRMMSATKQYNVTILLSQAVEELLSKPARSKLRHLDTVFVKGSSVEQRIFTYDARYEGVDFFLLERSPEQADYEADSYNTTVWENDQDLRAMRQHITDEFTEMFKKGVDQYLAGEWVYAIETLSNADDLMIQCILEEGYIDYKLDDIAEDLFDRRSTDEEVTRIRQDYGDGACKCLVNFMQKRKGIPPPDWKGVRPLTSK